MTDSPEGLPESLALAIEAYREAVVNNADDAALTHLCTVLVLWRAELRREVLEQALMPGFLDIHSFDAKGFPQFLVHEGTMVITNAVRYDDQPPVPPTPRPETPA